MNISKLDSAGSYLKMAIQIGFPVILQNVVSSLMSTLNVFMLGQLGAVAITSASIVNKWFLLYCVLANGIAAAGSVFISQYWGVKDKKRVQNFMGIMNYGMTGLALIFIIPSILMPNTVLSLYSQDTIVITTGINYLRIITVTFMLYSVNTMLTTALRSVGDTKISMFATLISLLVNAIGNYLLIFGNFNFPKLGVTGAGICLVIARLVELAIVVIYIAHSKPPIIGEKRDYFIIPKEFVNKFFRFGLALILGEAVYAVGSNLYNVIYKYTGTDAQASLQIVTTIQSLALLFCQGFGTAASVMLGNILGQKEFEKAEYCNRILTRASLVISVISAVIVYCSCPLFLNMFNIDAASMTNVVTMVRIMTLFIPVNTLVFVQICGTLRSGGDNLFCFLANLFGVWFVGLPLIYLAVIVFKMPITFVYLMAMMEEVGKLIICGPRVIKKKWIQNLT